jgi:hypothetical protein
LHLFQSINFSPLCFLFGIMNNKVAIITFFHHVKTLFQFIY